MNADPDLQPCLYIFKSFSFSLAKKRSRSQPKLSATAPDQILNRLRLQLKNLGSDSSGDIICTLYSSLGH